MKRTAIALGLAGVAAAGAASTLAQGAAPLRQGGSAKLACSPGTHTGQAVRELDHLKLRGKRVTTPEFVRDGDWVKTTEGGAGKLCLREGATVCELGAMTQLQVRPPKRDSVLVYLVSGNVSCSSSGEAFRHFETRFQLVKLNDLGLEESPLVARRTAGGAASGGNVFSLAVRNKRTTVKVRRGATVVARLGNLAKAVVLGREQQVAVPVGRDPSQPGQIRLTSAERRTFRELEGTRPDVDKERPTLSMEGPRQSSSVRRASFGFNANEQAIFSCALDDEVFRLCTSPLRLDHLKPGPHRFSVKATDPSGNFRSQVYSWTIDSSRIAFTSDRDGNLEIYVMDPDGQTQLRLTSNGALDEDPEWSRDGRRLAFNSARDGNSEIYVMNADGSSQTRITNHPAVDRNPTWSPDGTRIAFESYRDGNRELYVMNANGSSVRRLTNEPAEDLDPSWSPDGRKIAFASTRDQGNFEIYVMDADGGNQQRLTSNPAVEFNPSWSPDGRKLAFHSLRSGDYQNIYVMNADGSNVLRVTQTQLNDYNPAWAPDNGTIVFQSTRDDYPRSQIAQIYIMNADGSDQQKLTSQGSNIVPDW